MPPMDPQRLAAEFDAHGAVLVLYARQWLDAAAAEDVVQDAFIGLAQQRVAPDSPRAWLLRVVRNACLNQARAARRRRTHEQGRSVAGRAAWFDSRVDDLIDADLARRAVAALPAAQRELLVLRIWGELTLQEIGALLDEPVSTLWGRYHTALQALRRQLEQSCTRKTN